MYPGKGTVVLIRPAQTFYERIKVGSGTVNDFTALGDTINVAARLQAEAAAGEIVMSEPVYQEVATRYPDLEQREVTLRGKDEPFSIRTIRAEDLQRT